MSDRFVTIDQFQFLPEADTMRMHLQGAGIDAMLVDAETVSTDWALGNAIGYIKLQVKQSQQDQAREVLDQMRTQRNARREAEEQGEDTYRCLACEAKLRPDETTCPQCGWSYAKEEEDLLPTGDDEPSETVPVEQPVPDHAAPRESAGTLDSLRSWKRILVIPLLVLMLVPVVGGIIFLLFTIWFWF